MRSKLWLVAAVAWAGLLLAGAGGCKKTPKQVQLKVLLPDDAKDIEVLVQVDHKDFFKGKGTECTGTANVAADQDTFLVTVFWEPNNYTKITRPRKVAYKDGEIVVDARKQNLKDEKDDIVVRFVPTPQDVVEAMCKMANVGKDDVVYDLGCGDGRLVITAVKQFGAKRGVGVDLDPDLVKKCEAAAAEAGVKDKVEFRIGDVLLVNDMSDATVVLLYMGDDIMKRLQPVLKKTLKPGSRVVSHRFLWEDDWKPDRSETMRSNAGYDCTIHLWEVKK